MTHLWPIVKLACKIGVEETIALVAATGQKVDWVKVAPPKGLNAEKWKDFVKGAKLY
jgi:hypothetical protein